MRRSWDATTHGAALWLRAPRLPQQEQQRRDRGRDLSSAASSATSSELRQFTDELARPSLRSVVFPDYAYDTLPPAAGAALKAFVERGGLLVFCGGEARVLRCAAVLPRPSTDMLN